MISSSHDFLHKYFHLSVIMCIYIIFLVGAEAKSDAFTVGGADLKLTP